MVLWIVNVDFDKPWNYRNCTFMQGGHTLEPLIGHCAGFLCLWSDGCGSFGNGMTRLAWGATLRARFIINNLILAWINDPLPIKLWESISKTSTVTPIKLGCCQCCLSLEVTSSIPAKSTIIYWFLCGLYALSGVRASKLNQQICISPDPGRISKLTHTDVEMYNRTVYFRRSVNHPVKPRSCQWDCIFWHIYNYVKLTKCKYAC